MDAEDLKYRLAVSFWSEDRWGHWHKVICGEAFRVKFAGAFVEVAIRSSLGQWVLVAREPARRCRVQRGHLICESKNVTRRAS